MHDDQHGTAIVVLAALRNAALLTGRHSARSGRSFPEPARLVSRARRSSGCGLGDITIVDSRGIIHSGRRISQRRNGAGVDDQYRRHDRRARRRSARRRRIYRCVRGTVPEDVVATMAPNAIVFALAKPAAGDRPADRHALCRRRGDAAATSQQINNVLAFPGSSAARSTPAHWPSPSD